MPDRFVDGNVRRRASPYDVACEHLTDFRNNVRIVDQSGMLGTQEFSALAQGPSRLSAM